MEIVNFEGWMIIAYYLAGWWENSARQIKRQSKQYYLFKAMGLAGILLPTGRLWGWY